MINEDEADTYNKCAINFCEFLTELHHVMTLIGEELK